MEKLFQDEPEINRAQLLRESCMKVEKTSWQRHFTQDELEAFKEEFSQKHIELGEADTELKEYKERHKERITPMKDRSSQLLDHIKTKKEDHYEDCFAFDDQEAGTVSFYNRKGEKVSERKLMPSEKQTNIFTINKTGTNGE